MTPGVFEFDTSSVLGLATYPMNVRFCPLVDRFMASSDLDEKLVTMWSSVLSLPDPPGSAGTGSVLTRCPDGVTWSRKTGEVMPKLPSTESLFQTPGYEPLLLATAQPLVHPGGRTVTPGW